MENKLHDDLIALVKDAATFTNPELISQIVDSAAGILNLADLQGADEKEEENDISFRSTCLDTLLTVLKAFLQYLLSDQVLNAYFQSHLFELVCLLLPLMMSPAQAIAPLAPTITQIAEIWYHRRYENYEQVVPYLIPHLLQQSLEAKATSAEIKRLFKLREALQLFDLEDESFENIHSMLLCCSTSPAFLKVWTSII